MEAKELKIGNLAEYNGNLIEIVEIKRTVIMFKYINTLISDNYIQTEYENIKPVIITEALLLNFDGKRDENNDVFIYLNESYDTRLYLTDGFIQLCKSSYCPISNYYHIKYIHLLQNLYFALEDKELTINN